MDYQGAVIKRSSMHADLLRLIQISSADVIAQIAYCCKRTV